MSQQPTARQRIRVPSASANWEAVVREWPEDAARVWTRRAVELAALNDVIDAIVATGSSVRDVEFSDDLDLVIVYAGCRPTLPRPPVSIDLRRYEREEVNQKLAEGHDYLSWTVRFGRVLFQRDNWWTGLRENWNGRLCLPSVDEALARADKAACLSRELRDAGDDDAADELQLSMLTHRSRAELSRARVFPKSRPEIEAQLRGIGQHDLADRLADALERRPKTRIQR